MTADEFLTARGLMKASLNRPIGPVAFYRFIES